MRSNEAQDHLEWFDVSELSDPKAYIYIYSYSQWRWNERMFCWEFKVLNENLSLLTINVIISIFKLIQLVALTSWTMRNCEIFHTILSNFKTRFCVRSICRTQFFVIAHFKLKHFNRLIGSIRKATGMENRDAYYYYWLNLPI